MSNNYKERPFEFLRRKKAPSEGELFDGKIVKNWYEARATGIQESHRPTGNLSCNHS